MPSTPEQEPEELAQFREAWKAEVLRKKASDTVTNESLPGSARLEQRESESQPGPSSHTISGLPVPTIPIQTIPSRPRGSALEVYRRAARHEQHGELDDALVLYRQAFRLDPNVDRAYAREERIAAVLAADGSADLQKRGLVPLANDSSTEMLAQKLEYTLDLRTSSSGKGRSTVTGTLASLVETFPNDSVFEAEDEQQQAPLKMLPDELLVLILRKLDPASIERFASVSRKARIVSLDSTIWRELVTTTYKPPQVLDLENIEMISDRYSSDYRRIYIEHPRLRLDGVYIAVCHYVRAGISENHWVNISHLITYHRYLRFFSNGQVLSLLTNEEHDPKQIIPTLKPSLRIKGLSTGSWHLQGTTVHLSNLIDASGRRSLPTHATSLSHTHSNTSQNMDVSARYVFTMTLTLRSRPMGRWNKLDITSYDSVNLETGDITPVVLKHERPFWFSKVKSYTA